MSDNESENEVDESGRNPTQQEIDERGASDAPADSDWTEPPAADPDAAISGREGGEAA